MCSPTHEEADEAAPGPPHKEPHSMTTTNPRTGQIALGEVAEAVTSITRAETLGWEDEVATLSGYGFLAMALGWETDLEGDGNQMRVELFAPPQEIAALRGARSRAAEWACHTRSYTP